MVANDLEVERTFFGGTVPGMQVNATTEIYSQVMADTLIKEMGKF